MNVGTLASSVLLFVFVAFGTVANAGVSRDENGWLRSDETAGLKPLVCGNLNAADWQLFANESGVTFMDEYVQSAEALTHAPIVYRPGFLNETSLFRGSTWFRANPVSFARTTRPMIRDRNLVMQILLNNGSWRNIDLKPLVQLWARHQWRAHSFSEDFEAGRFFLSGVSVDERIVMDRNCHLYTIVQANRSPDIGDILLLHSPDGGERWKVHPLGVGSDPLKAARLETSATSRFLDQPPTILIHNFYTIGAQFSDLNLDLFVPTSSGDQLTIGCSILVATDSILAGLHSGAGNAAVTIGNTINIVYPIASTEYAGAEYGSTVFLGRVYDKSARDFVPGPPQFIGNSAPYYNSGPGKWDDHDQPALARDQDNRLHLVIAGHNTDLLYMRSSHVGSIAGGFATPIGVRQHMAAACDKPCAGRGLYTYPSLAIDSRANVHMVVRAIDSPGTYRNLQADNRLVYLRKRADSESFDLFQDPLDSSKWNPHQVLLDPARNRYGIFYHKLSIDTGDRLWIAYSYAPDDLTPAEAEDYRVRYGLPSMSPPQYCTYDEHFDMDRCSYEELRPRDYHMIHSSNLGTSWRFTTTPDLFW